MEPIKKLKGKTVAIVGMGASWLDYNLAKSHGSHFDEVWAINAVGTVIYHDRVFMMDPPSRFLDSDDAGGQTEGMRKLLTSHDKPIYTCELDKRCKNLQPYPINEVLRDLQSSYLNNTVAYAIAFALWNEVSVEVANTSTLLDASVPLDEKLYGYHRLDDPLVPVIDNGVLSTKKLSEGKKTETEQKPVLIGRHENITIGEPNKW